MEEELNRIRIFGIVAFLFFAANIFYGGFQGFKWGTGTTSGEIIQRYNIRSYNVPHYLGKERFDWLDYKTRYSTVQVKIRFGFSWQYFSKAALVFKPVDNVIKQKIYNSLLRNYGASLNDKSLRIVHPKYFWSFNLSYDAYFYIKKGRWILPTPLKFNSYGKLNGSYATTELFYIWKTTDTIILAQKNQFSDDKDEVKVYYLDRSFEGYADKLIQAVQKKIDKQKSLKFDSIL